MKCYICDSTIDEPQFDPRDRKVRPCGKCLDSVQDCLDGFKKQDEGDGFNRDGALAFADILDTGIEDVTSFIITNEIDPLSEFFE